MRLYQLISGYVANEVAALQAAGELPPSLSLERMVVETPRDASHGDLACNAAMVLAKPAGKNPRALAELLAERLTKYDEIDSAEVAGPGFLNFHVNASVWPKVVAAVLSQGAEYGRSDIGKGTTINVEYVSANPTGPMHAGHARGACFGDALASLLDAAGYKVIREYLINDAGAQVIKLARSTHLRYRQAFGEEIKEIPEGLYPGEYLIEVGEALKARDGEKWLGLGEGAWQEPLREFATSYILNEMIKVDLERLGIHHDTFFSEKAMQDSGAVGLAFNVLKERDLIYTGVLEAPKGQQPEDWEPRPQALFRATQFGDDIDRPLQKSDGTWTYFAADIAYHYDKYKRGADILIDIFGADHHGYVKRIRAATNAITNNKAHVEVMATQMVKFSKGGKPVKMSKRAGTFVTLSDILDEIGPDALRFVMLTRKIDQHFELDFDKVLEQSKDNPVFYVQYAHARCKSVLRHATEMFPDLDISESGLAGADLSRLNSDTEQALIKLMAAFPYTIESAARAYEPHRIAYFVQDVAAAFHSLWNEGRENTALRFLHEDNRDLTATKLALVRATALVLAGGLAILGVKPAEQM